ncbi:TonB-dependent siderophore receptor [Actinobacillus vicugnae]|uniref:TonB-dependent siderophore receptor n=1 Tax=Actinobacillus vicugnae TaxID=2573093 RepID=UPI00123F7C50|nr:TonB-dependent siderophore receptor [Actinobacillus vicugnae]
MKKTFFYSTVASAVALAISPVMAEETVVLDEVDVVGSINKIGQGVEFLSAQSNAVINADQIKASGAKKVDEVLKYEAGVQVGSYGNDTKQEWMKIRGFDPSLVIDGAPVADHGFYRTMPNTYGIEAIEIVKGADSITYGAAQTGGLVNIVTKRPTQEAQGEIGVNYGTQGYRGVFGDYSGALTSDNRIRYRLVGDYNHREGDTNGRTDNYYFAPSLTLDLSKNTNITLLSSFSRQVGNPTSVHMPANGTLFPTSVGKIARGTDYSEPNDEYVKRNVWHLGYEFNHDFGDGLKFSQNYHFTQQQLDWLGVFAWSSDGARTAYRGYSYTDGKVKTHTVDNRLSKKWQGENWSNTLLGGVDYVHSKTTGLNNGFGLVNPTDLFNPVAGNSGVVKAGSIYDNKQRQNGFYLRDQFTYGNFVGNVGIRRDKAYGYTVNSASVSNYDTYHTSHQASAMYNFDIGVSPYVSYSESFRPLAGVDSNNNLYKPYEGQQYEAGLKLLPSWLDGKISFAYFHLKEKNALVADASAIQRQVGERVSKGIEIQADANLTENISAAVSYAYTKAEQDISATKKVRAALVPRHQASAQLNYHFKDNTLNGLTVGTAVRYVGTTVDEQYFPGYKVPAYTLVDLSAQYEFAKNWRAQLNITNLTDKKYLAGCDYYCYFGAERSVSGSLSYKF